MQTTRSEQRPFSFTYPYPRDAAGKLYYYVGVDTTFSDQIAIPDGPGQVIRTIGKAYDGNDQEEMAQGRTLMETLNAAWQSGNLPELAPYEKAPSPPESTHMIVSAYRGVVPVAIPLVWVKLLLPHINKSFACSEHGHALIRVPGHGAYGVQQIGNAGRIYKLTHKQEENVQWGAICQPWEPYGVASMFGMSSETYYLDRV